MKLPSHLTVETLDLGAKDYVERGVQESHLRIRRGPLVMDILCEMTGTSPDDAHFVLHFPQGTAVVRAAASNSILVNILPMGMRLSSRRD